MAYEIVHSLIHSARNLLAKVDGHDRTDRGYRDIVIGTQDAWPSHDELRLRDAVERAIASSNVAEVVGTDAGSGSMSVFVRLKGTAVRGREPGERPSRKTSKVSKISNVGSPPPTMGDGTALGFVLLLLDEMIAEDAASKRPVLAADEALRSWMTALRADLAALPDRVGRPAGKLARRGQRPATSA